MIFSEIQKGHALYIVSKAGGIALQQTIVSSKGQPYPAPMQQPYSYNLTTPSLIVDLTVDINGQQRTYSVPERSEIAYDDKNGMIITSNRDLALREVEMVRKQAQDRIEHHDADKQMVAQCDGILAEWNPVMKEKRENERRFKGIEDEIGGVKEDVRGIRDMLKEYLNKNRD